MRFKIFLILMVFVAGFLTNSYTENFSPAKKSQDRIETGSQQAPQIEGQKPASASAGVETGDDPTVEQSQAEPGSPRRQAMAVENVVQAQDACGIELTASAQVAVSRDKALESRPFADERAVLANLWRETFKCNPDFAGENCFAARWQMCQRAYAEYGPDGIRLKGLIKAIVKK